MATGKRLKYHLVPRKINPQDPNSVVGVGPNVVYKGRLGLDEISQELSMKCTLTDVDIESVVQSFLTLSAFYLLNSKSLRLGRIGYLCSAIKTDLVEKADQYTRSNIRKAKPVFVASSELKNVLKGLRYEAVKKVEKKEEVKVTNPDQGNPDQGNPDQGQQGPTEGQGLV